MKFFFFLFFLFHTSVLFSQDSIMARPAAQDRADKFSRYRAGKRSQGLKMLRLWVPDPAAPGFAKEAARQARLTMGDPDSADALAFIEAAAAWPSEPYDWGPSGPPESALAKPPK